jgi:hypothetical protein
MNLIYLSLLAFSLACTQLRVPYLGKKKTKTYLENYQAYEATDYVSQWSALDKFLDSGMEMRYLYLRKKDLDYLRRVTDQIIISNEVIFKDVKQVEVMIIVSSIPFHFSLPGRKIFLSSSLISRHLKHEAMLAAVLTQELVRSENNLYPKTLIIPWGYLSVERMLLLQRLSMENRLEIHKVAYYLLKRANFDGEYYLSWLQMMNKNVSEFSYMLGDVSLMSREEATFKQFLISQPKSDNLAFMKKSESSKGFYQFIFAIKDQLE